MIKEPLNVLELPMPERGLRALKVAVKKAIEDHAREGLPIYIWRDGRVLEVPPDKLHEQSALLSAESK
jgi:hypothetical protein